MSPKISCLVFLIFLYSQRGISQTFTSSNLPLVIINTNGQSIVDDPKITANLSIIWNGPGKRNALTDPVNGYNGKIGIEIRGSSSQSFPKKGYGFETRTADSQDVDVSLLGMPEENDWVLYAPYTDKTMIRDVLTYTLDAGLGHWSPRCRYVELFLNGNYQGVYVLMEKIKRDKNRVNIAKLTTTDNSGEDLTGGYIIKIDKLTGSGGDGWYSDYYNINQKTYYQYDYPKSDEITGAQKTYIQTYVRNMEKALYQAKYSGTGSYHDYLDDSSFIDFMIINELSRNVDGYRLSSYLYKGKNSLMNCGPIWDFNLTYGNADYYNGWLTSGFQYQASLSTDSWQNPFWWSRLMGDPNFVEKLKKRWATLRKKQLSNERISTVADSLVNLLAEARVRNFQRWPIIGKYVWPNYYVGPSYDSEVQWMKDWISQRLAYLDQMWPYTFTGNQDQLAFQSTRVFPNPFTDELTIQLAPDVAGNGFAEIFSSGGSALRKIPVVIQNGLIQLQLSGNNMLVPGMYVLRITSQNRILLTEKIVKSR